MAIAWKLAVQQPNVQSYALQQPTAQDRRLLEVRLSGSVSQFPDGVEGRKVTLRLKYAFPHYTLDCTLTLFDDRPDPHCFPEGGVQRTWDGPAEFQSALIRPEEERALDPIGRALLAQLPSLDPRYFAVPAQYQPHTRSRRV